MIHVNCLRFDDLFKPFAHFHITVKVKISLRYFHDIIVRYVAFPTNLILQFLLIIMQLYCKMKIFVCLFCFVWFGFLFVCLFLLGFMSIREKQTLAKISAVGPYTFQSFM